MIGMPIHTYQYLRRVKPKSILENSAEWEPEHASQWQSWRQRVGLPTRVK
jgi:hypothetical protein